MGAWRVGVDVGGTFTDLVALSESTGERVSLKVLTTPGDSAIGFLDALAELHRRARLPSKDIATIFHGTTLVTNAIIERKLPRVALVTTKGFRDILEIARHWRPDLYDLTYTPPLPLVPRPLRLEVDERIGPGGDVEHLLDDGSIDQVIAELGSQQAEAVAVVLLHSYANPQHEQELTRRLRDALPGTFLSASAELSREAREYERTATTALNAALIPLIDDYLTKLETTLVREGYAARLYITHSNGGALSADAARSRPVGLAQSGPVAGVHACAELGKQLGYENAIGFDMGGTSADIALVEGTQPRLSTELHIGGLPVRLPAVQVDSIGAGGGSIAKLDEVGALVVGPESAGARPGPACYGQGGTRPTVTDANLVLGRLPVGGALAGFLELDMVAAERAFDLHIAGPLGITVQQAAQGVLDVVNAAMEGSVRVALRERGDDPRDFVLVAFGGAGPLHAVELASRLSIGTVIVPRHPGTLSAQGLISTDLRQDFAVSHSIHSNDPNAAYRLESAFGELEAMASDRLGDDGDFGGSAIREWHCDIRYIGQAHEVSVPFNAGAVTPDSLIALVANFHDKHERIYAFAERDEPCEIRTQRLFVTSPAKVVTVAKSTGDGTVPAGTDGMDRRREGERATASIIVQGQAFDCAVIERSSLQPGAAPVTPSVIMQEDATTFIPPDVTVTVASTGELLITGIPAQ